MIASVAQFSQWITGNESSLTGDVCSVCIDSRLVGPGGVFFALQGDQTDGHNYIDQALEQGAVLVVAELSNDLSQSFRSNERVLLVQDGVEVLQKAALAHRQTFDLPVIAITGTNGKTTTKEMMAAVLGQKYKLAVTPGNYNNHLGVPLFIFQWQRDAELALVEMGTNHFGEIATLCNIALPSHGLITNIGQGHLEFLIDEEGVARAKAELLDFLSPDKVAFLNADDIRLFSRKSKVKQTVLFGSSEEADFRGEIVGPDQDGFHSIHTDRFQIRVPVLGRHNGYNALAALAVGHYFGVGLNQMQYAIEGFKAVDQRMQKIQIGGLTVLNDAYNANPSSMNASLIALAGLVTEGRRIAVLGDMAELGGASDEAHKVMGVLAAGLGLDSLYLVGEKMRLMFDGATQSGMINVNHYETVEQMVAQLVPSLIDADVLLVKGSRSMALEAVVQAVQHSFKK